jgi:hypothetical protein
MPSILKEAPMHKKLIKTAAFIVLFAFLFLWAPGLSSAKPGKIDIRLLVRKPAIWITSFWNLITPIFDNREDTPKGIIPSDSVAKIKPLTESLSPKPSRGD